MQKNYAISVAKALAIILMVVGHSGSPEWMHDYIYLFHMPLFFFVSGYLFKEKYFDNTWVYIKRKVQTIYWPFVKWSLIFLIFHNVLYALNCYSEKYVASDFLKKGFSIITMTGSEQLLGGFWFLKELFLVSIICFATLYITRKNQKPIYLLLYILLYLAIAFVYSLYPQFKIPFIGTRTFIASAVFISGYAYRKVFAEKNNGIVGLVLGGVVSVGISVAARLNGVGMSMSVTGINILPYYVGAMAGIIFILNLAKGIKGKWVSVFDYVGSRTMYILVFHFLSFKLVSLFIIWREGLDISRLSDFPYIATDNAWYWVLYSIIGVLLPLGIEFCISKAGVGFRSLTSGLRKEKQ